MASSPSHSSKAAIIAARLRQRQMLNAAGSSIKRRVSGDSVEASDEQRRIWLHCALSGQSELYNETFTIRYKGKLDVPSFERAFHEIVARHEAWRTSFSLEGNRILQNVQRILRAEIPFLDLRKLRPKQCEKRIAGLILEDSRKPFDLAKIPLFRSRLLRIADQEFLFTLVSHHIICDGISIFQVFPTELHSAYTAFAKGISPLLPPLPFQYPDYAQWQSETADPLKLDTNILFWQRKLGHIPPIMNLPLDRDRPAVRTLQGGAERLRVSQDLTQSLKNIGESCKATLFMTLLASLHAFFYLSTGQLDQLIGSVSSTRREAETDELLGVFINMVLLRAELSPDSTFVELVRQIRESTLEVLTHEVPFDKLARRLGVQDIPAIMPLVQVMFVFEPAMARLPPEWEIARAKIEDPFPKCDLYIHMQEHLDELVGGFSYSRDVFDASTVEKLKDRWIEVLSILAANPDLRLKEIAAIEQQPAPAKDSRWKHWRRRFGIS